MQRPQLNLVHRRGGVRARQGNVLVISPVTAALADKQVQFIKVSHGVRCHHARIIGREIKPVFFAEIGRGDLVIVKASPLDREVPSVFRLPKGVFHATCFS